MILRMFQRADRLIGLACKWGVIGCLLGLFFLLLIAVIVRMVPVLAISGYDEIVEWLFVWMTFLGALALWREGALYRVTLIEAAVPPPLRRLIMVMSQMLMLALALVMTVKGYEFIVSAGETTPFLGIDKTYWYVSVPATGAIMALYSAIGLWRAIRGGLVSEESGPILG
jgi:TRAP-type C4-dicarboxylate transport system permease small subunit